MWVYIEKNYVIMRVSQKIKKQIGTVTIKLHMLLFIEN